MLKLIFNILIAVILISRMGAQEKKTPFSFEVSEIGDITSVLKGGKNSGKILALGQFDLVLGFDTEKAGWWKGGALAVHFLNNHGAEPSANYAGDLQLYSNIESGPHSGLFELFYAQKLGKYEFKTGWNNLNADFYWTEFGGLFLNSSFGISPGASLNVPVSIFPVTSPFVYLSYEISGNSKLQIASYAGNPGDLESNPYNLKWEINRNNGAMNILEYQYIKSESKYFGFKTGVYLHTADVKGLKDTTRLFKNSFGFYSIIDKNIIPAKNNFRKGLDAFVQFDLDPDDRCMVYNYIGAGLSYRGFFGKEKLSDEFGFGVAYMKFSNHWIKADPNRKKHETAIEFTYRLNYSDHLYVQPDFQYIINPGAGSSGNINDAFVGTIRFILCY